jgi:hypothetical protein
MTATTDRTNAPSGEVVRKAAVAAFEALPALLLAAALLMPALAAFAGRTATPPAPAPAAAPATELGREIADQGNRALIQIRTETRESLRQNITLPKLS